MDSILVANYTTLFKLYFRLLSIPYRLVPGHKLQLEVHKNLWDLVDEGILRIDAAHFAWLMFNQMIFLPYTGRFPGGKAKLEVGEFESRARDAAEILLETIRKKRLSPDNEEPLSAHQVMRTIDERWEQLSDLFMWG